MTKLKGKPYLERAEDITDLNTLVKRTNALNDCISNCNDDIELCSKNIKVLEDKHFDVKALGGFWYVSGSNDKADKAIVSALTEHFQEKIQESKELKQMCEIELHWLEVRIGVGFIPDTGSNKFRSKAFNFDPEENINDYRDRK